MLQVSAIEAETLWLMKLFYPTFPSVQVVIPDSAIAKKLACRKTKMNYLICFGIEPYLERNYFKRLKKSSV